MSEKKEVEFKKGMYVKYQEEGKSMPTYGSILSIVKDKAKIVKANEETDVVPVSDLIKIGSEM